MTDRPQFIPVCWQRWWRGERGGRQTLCLAGLRKHGGPVPGYRSAPSQVTYRYSGAHARVRIATVFRILVSGMVFD